MLIIKQLYKTIGVSKKLVFGVFENNKQLFEANTYQECEDWISTNPNASSIDSFEEVVNALNNKVSLEQFNNSSVSSSVPVESLTETTSGKSLDATQGKILKDIIDNIIAVVDSSDTALDTLQEIVDFIKINKDTLDALSIGSISGLQAALDGKLSNTCTVLYDNSSNQTGNLVLSQNINDFKYFIFYIGQYATPNMIDLSSLLLGVENGTTVLMSSYGTVYTRVSVVNDTTINSDSAGVKRIVGIN